MTEQEALKEALENMTDEERKEAKLIVDTPFYRIHFSYGIPLLIDYVR